MEQILSTYWPQVVALVGIVAWLAKMQSDVNSNTKGFKLVEAHKDQLAEVKEHLVEIKTDLKWMKESMKHTENVREYNQPQGEPMTQNNK